METIKEIIEKNKQNDVLTPQLLATLDPAEECLKDGDIYCLKCMTRRTCFGFTKKVRCLCKCQAEARQKEEDERERRNTIQRIESLRRASLLGDQYKNVSFEKTDLYNAKYAAIFARCEKYCQVYKEVLEKGHGIYLFGDPGTGKTHIAACMANALINKGCSVLYTNLNEISKAVRATYNKSAETELDFMLKLKKIEFLFIDDFGTERVAKDNQDLWLQEKVFEIVNTRYNDKKPIIFTSNYALQEMVQDRGLSTKTADRIGQTCAIMELRGESYRKKAKNETKFAF